jgi:myo-inositol-1(or 4)-monophosphatase
MFPLSDYLDVAVRAAHAGAAILQHHRTAPNDLVIDHKGRNDLVSQADRESEQVVIEILRQANPQIGLIGEESGGARGAELTWYVDPLDGTTNYLHGVGHYAVSIGLIAHAGAADAMGNPLLVDTPILGVIYDPNREEMFTGMHGVGAWCNGHRIQMAALSNLADALIGIGIPMRDFSYIDPYLAALKEILLRSRGVRRQGSAALDLAWVACGRINAYWEQGIAPWDVAAGTVIAREAGAWVNDPYNSQASWPQSGRVLAIPPKLKDEFLALIQPSLGPVFADD